MIQYAVAFLCVLGLAVGQIIFKLSAGALAESGTFFAPKPAVTLFIAMSLYGVTSIAWVWVLQKVELGKIYPLMALAFVLVPLGAYFVFGERFRIQYFAGVALIVSGIVVAVRA
jgi:drug/metabolite transporter (DMT)-like permease